MSPHAIWHVVTDYWLVVVDVLVVWWLIYRLLLLAKGTRAWQVIVGLLVFVSAIMVSDKLHLDALHWLLKQAFPLGPVAIVILFLPELRHALEQLGQIGFWRQSLGLVKTEDLSSMVDHVVAAAATMSIKRMGALIVFERESGLEDIIATGTEVDAETTSSLLTTIFYKGTPLHDGAVIMRGARIWAAACTLPLTSSPRVDATVHTRHKAAIGMSESSDAVVLVVSEETGTISLSVDGKLVRGLRDDILRQRLCELLQITDPRGARAAIGTVANRVGGALKTARTARRGFGQ